MYALCHNVVPFRMKLVNCKFIFTLSRLMYKNSNAKASCREITIPSPWGEISGKWWGSKDTLPILSIHGWEDNAGSFDRIASLLKKSVLAIDLPGHGYSPFSPVATSYNFMDGVTLLRHIVRHFKWQEITLMGHSYGGAVALAYAAFFPESVKHLIEIECSRNTLALKSELAASALRNTIECILSTKGLILEEPHIYSWNELVGLWQSHRGKSTSKETCECLLNRCTKKVGEDKYIYLRDPRLEELPLGRMTDDMLIACASRITCKVLSVLADPGLNIAGSCDYKEITNLIKKSAMIFEEHIVEGSHHVHIENPIEVAQIITDFLSKTETVLK